MFLSLAKWCTIKEMEALNDWVSVKSYSKMGDLSLYYMEEFMFECLQIG